jgi:hypothetical protein
MRALVAALIVVVAAIIGCATPKKAAEGPQPHVRVLADEKAPVDVACPSDHKVEVVRGAVPLGAVVLTEARSSSENGMKARLEDHEALARKLALRFCADGVSILSADEVGGFIATTRMALWRRPEANPQAAAPE